MRALIVKAGSILNQIIPKIPLKRLRHNLTFNMEKAYLRHLEEQKFEIAFQYVDSTVKVNRQFNLLRHVSESVESFTSRVGTNVQKEIMRRMKIKAVENAPAVQVKLFLNDQEVGNSSNVSCDELFNNVHNKVILSVCDKRFDVVINSPWISGLALPNSIMASFLVYPTKFDSVYCDKKFSEFSWFKSKDKLNWTLVGDSFIYQTRNEDIGHHLKFSCLPGNQTKIQGPKAETESKVKVEASPGVLPFESRQKFTTDRCMGKKFRIVTYNILADLYCSLDYTREVLHPYCAPYALNIDYRKQLIIKELFGYNADIICLQEVDRKVYNHDFKTIFEELGFDSDLCLKSMDVAEGLACFFRRDRFQRLDSVRLALCEELNNNEIFGEIWEKVKVNEELSKRLLDRSTVLQVTVLQTLDEECENEVLVVANTHLYFHPDADHIRLLQAGMIIKFLENYIEELKKKIGDTKRISLIFCGDFNTVPECGIYQLFTTGSVQRDHIDFQSNTEQAVKDVDLHQTIPLKSACGTPEYTNFTAGFAACLDYIFYQYSNLEVVQVVPMPSTEELQQHTALPSIVFPSDHVSLISDLKFK